MDRGKNAYIEGYRVAGKTGTANKVENGKYAEGKHVVSFIGYAPVENPKLAAIVIVDEPNSNVASGGMVAAPVFKEVIEKSLNYLAIMPSDVTEEALVNHSEHQLKEVPNYLGLSVNQARNNNVIVVGTGSKVMSQYPLQNTKINFSTPTYIFTDNLNNESPPDLTGMPLIDVINISRILDFKLIVNGEGYVVSQSFSEKNKKLTVILKP
ncbi:penicillin-binding transpeptidase domain-containing protein [Paenibacillus sp. BC26]|uniref:penicillin-binding transpeptidase domain-containing protein n=1 Tax=Paenibacillus sp. BC26 TaxID=1881032 RepID=UPI000A998A7C|nr:penicillin-binding transpeptidase domain-containing protein [Paenibacillus sp. BC26]